MSGQLPWGKITPWMIAPPRLFLPRIIVLEENYPPDNNCPWTVAPEDNWPRAKLSPWMIAPELLPLDTYPKDNCPFTISPWGYTTISPFGTDISFTFYSDSSLV